MIRFLLLISAVLMNSGCVTVQAFPFDTAPRTPIAAETVRFVERRPEGCEAIARLSVKAESAARAQQLLAAKAASLGADIVVLESSVSNSGGGVLVGNVVVPITSDSYTATALSCLTAPPAE